MQPSQGCATFKRLCNLHKVVCTLQRIITRLCALCKGSLQGCMHLAKDNASLSQACCIHARLLQLGNFYMEFDEMYKLCAKFMLLSKVHNLVIFFGMLFYWKHLCLLCTQKTNFSCNQDCNSTSVAIHVKCFNHKIITLHLLNY